MKRVAGFLVLVLVFGLWLFSSTHSQQSVAQDAATAQAQLTAVARPTPSPTP